MLSFLYLWDHFVAENDLKEANQTIDISTFLVNLPWAVFRSDVLKQLQTLCHN